MDARHRIEDLGSDLRLRVAGPDLGACLVAAVRGVARAVAGDPAGHPGGEGEGPPQERRDLRLDEDSPAALLVALVDELVLLLDADGLLAVDLDVREAHGGRLAGELALVAVDPRTLDGVTPKAATWHDLHLAPSGDGWEGRIVLDL